MPTTAFTDETEKSTATPAIILAVVAILVALLMVKFGLQTITWIEGKMWAAQSPWIKVVPQALPAPNAPVKGQIVRAFDFQVSSPWPGNPKPKPQETNVAFQYDTGQVLVFFDPGTQIDTLHAIQSSNPLEFQKFSNVFLGTPIGSNFELYGNVYGASPDRLSPFMNSAEAVRINALLLWKLSFGEDLPCAGQFYSFDWKDIHGFQFGDPAKGRPVAVRAFDDRSHQFRFILTAVNGENGKITQDDINQILQTIQPTPFEDR